MGCSERNKTPGTSKNLFISQVYNQPGEEQNNMILLEMSLHQPEIDAQRQVCY